jgi:hypothetical protein
MKTCEHCRFWTSGPPKRYSVSDLEGSSHLRCLGCGKLQWFIYYASDCLRFERDDAVWFEWSRIKTTEGRPNPPDKRSKIGVFNATHDLKFIIELLPGSLTSDPLPKTEICTLPCEWKRRFDPESFKIECRSWMEYCLNAHSRCSPTARGRLPKRVIDVGSREAHLYEPMGEFADYVALSHAWSYSLPIKTEKQNLNSRIGRLVWNELPTAFQEAIIIVRALGLRYLWIDSLCIIQDDDEDWEVQAARMAFIYENAYLTIMLHQSEPGGSSFPRQHGLWYETSSTFSPYSFRYRPVLSNGFVSGFDNCQTDLMSSRGWCFQVIPNQLYIHILC